MRVTSTKEAAKLKMEYRGVAMRPIVKEEQIFLKTKLKLTTDVQISFCYFHFCQSLLRHVQNQSKKSRYGETEDIYRKYVRMAAALAFLPAKDVIKGFKLLKDCNGDSDVSEFLEYFEKTCIGVPNKLEPADAH